MEQIRPGLEGVQVRVTAVPSSQAPAASRTADKLRPQVGMLFLFM